MKVASLALFLFVGACFATFAEGAGDKTITKVVKLLQKMLDKSKKESEDDKNAYAKYKCYVDKNEAEKTESIKKLGEQIELLESKIAELQARNGELSGQNAQLNADMSANKEAQKQATKIREDSAKSFKQMAEDLDKAIGQMKEAIDVLTAIALNQDHVKFMAGSSKDKKRALLLNLGTEVRTALGAASALLPPEKRASLEAFLQAPLAAAHSTQGDAIVGILKNLKTTFESNLKNAKESEAAEKKAFEESVDTLEDSWKKMEKSLKEKKTEMGDNDGELSSKKTSLDEAKKQKESDEEFLSKLMEMAEKKAKDYEERKMMRANEDAAIAECISILNSDAAFDTFGDVSATSTGATSFFQLARGGAVRRQAELLLERAHSTRLSRVAAGLRSGHAFTTVLEEIEKMKKTIVEEADADKENLDWCKKERENSKKDLEAKKSQIKTLKESIDKLDETINDPKTGLKVQIGDTEADIVKNQKAQADQTETRKKENAAYQEDVSNLSDAEDILGKAVKVLKRYYDALDAKMKEKSFIQLSMSEDPAPPKTYDAYSGQSKAGGDAISMLEFILSETEKEHKTADKDEKTAQDDFEDSMAKLKKAEAEAQKSLIKLKADLAEKEKELVEKTSDLKDTEEAKAAIEKYLLKIKPGCDFITENYDLREKNRDTETKALEKAVKLIKDTPAYKDAVAKEKELAAGKCKAECKLDTTNLDCKVCMSGSSKADYCKSKPGTPGCK